MRLHLLLLFALCSSSVGYEDYSAHKIVRITPDTEDEMDLLRRLNTVLGYEVQNQIFLSFIPMFPPDYLRSVRSPGRPGDMVVRPENLSTTIRYLRDTGIQHTVLDHNLATMAQRDRRALLSVSSGPIDYDVITTKYLPFDEQMRLVDQLTAAYPSIIRTETIGYSTEGRPIRMMTFGQPSSSPKPILWIEAGIHAREWIAPSAALYAMWMLATDRKWAGLLSAIDVIILPNVNPDGYEFSRTNDRLWRKTRSLDGTSQSCFGVDGNRNYPFHWGEEGVSNNACKEIYCGTHALSEPEVRALVDAIQTKRHLIKGYLTLHSYGQDILYPWGHKTNTFPPDVEELIAMGKLMAAAIRGVSGTEYTVANSAGGLYPASGASDDWAKSIGVKYTYTIELSPRSAYYGFELPPNFIESVAKENFAGMMSLGQMIAANRTALQGSSSGSGSLPKQMRRRISGRQRSHSSWG